MNSPLLNYEMDPREMAAHTELFSEKLRTRLETVVKEREEVTPELDYPELDEDGLEKMYRHLAENHKEGFGFRTIEKRRQLIANTEYWRIEAQSYATAVDKFQQDEPSMNDWRNLAKGYRRLLVYLGVSSHDVEKLRLSIKGKTYWELESNFFKEEASLREYEFLERRRKIYERRRQRLAGSPVQGRQAGESKTNTILQEADPVSGRTRSKTQSRGVRSRPSRNGHMR